MRRRVGAALTARVRRLERLSLGLAREIFAERTGHDLLLYVERLEYRAALHNALSGVEGARFVLAKACRRISKSR
jgi:hypothetical protein